MRDLRRKKHQSRKRKKKNNKLMLMLSWKKMKVKTLRKQKPKFCNKEMSTGRIKRTLIIGFNRFYRRNVFKSSDGAMVSSSVNLK